MKTNADKRLNMEPLDLGEEFEDGFEALKADRNNIKTAADTVVRENEQLRRQNEELRRASESEPIPNSGGVLMVLVAIILMGRLALYVFAEDWGTKAHLEGMISNGVCGAGALAILVAWIYTEWTTVQWLMIPKAVTVFVAMVICTSSLITGVGSPLAVSLAAVVVLLFAASPFWIWFLRVTMRLLNDPVGTFRRKP